MWWGDPAQPSHPQRRGLDFLSKQPVPKEVPAPASHGTNPSDTNGVGWDWASPQAWQPNPGVEFPDEPIMSPVPPDLVCIDPTNTAVGRHVRSAWVGLLVTLSVGMVEAAVGV